MHVKATRTTTAPKIPQGVTGKTPHHTLRRKGFISAMYLEPLKGSIQNPLGKKVLY